MDRLLIRIAVALAVAAVVGAMVGSAVALHAIQRSRLDATISSCRDRNTEHELILEFLQAEAPRLQAQARTVFTIERDCTAYAHGLLR